MKLRIFLALVGIFIAGAVTHANLVNHTSYQFSSSANGPSAGNAFETISTIPGMVYDVSFLGNISMPYTPTAFNFMFGDCLNHSLVNDLTQQYYRWYFNQSSTSVAPFNFYITADDGNTSLGFQYALTSENYGVSIRNLTVQAVPDGVSTIGLAALTGGMLLAVRRCMK